jgi:hypothetical protein
LAADIVARRVRNGRITFDYRCACADCDEAGTMVLIEAESGTVNCPAGCGAVYAPWRGPDRKWRLRCVVLPVYGDPEREASAFDDPENDE